MNDLQRHTMNEQSIFRISERKPEPGSPATVGLVAACMARGLTPEQTQAVFTELYGVLPASSADAIQRQLEDAINRVIGKP